MLSRWRISLRSGGPGFTRDVKRSDDWLVFRSDRLADGFENRSARGSVDLEGSARSLWMISELLQRRNCGLTLVVRFFRRTSLVQESLLNTLLTACRTFLPNEGGLRLPTRALTPASF